MNIPKFAVKRPVAISMIMLLILLLGGISFFLLRIELLPKIKIPKLVVETEYTNASPSEIEELITKPLEENLATLQNLKGITSISTSEKSIIIMQFYWQTDIDLATVKTREKLDRVKERLPDDVERPNILNFDPTEKPVISYAIKGDNDLYTITQIGKNMIKRRFEQIEGVAKADISGLVEKEIVVNISPQKLYRYGITEQMIANEIRSLNRNYSGGKLIDGWYQYTVKFPKNIETPEDIRNISIYNARGDKFQLSELGKIYSQNQTRKTLARVNGEDAIILNIIKNSDANTVEVCKRVSEAANNWNTSSDDIKLALLHDDSQLVLKSIYSVIQAILIGGVLAFFVLMIFLKNIKSPITISFSMPFSIITTFILLYFSGISLNILSMGGLAIGIGLLVDNSIIVLENIVHYQEKGTELKQACVSGTNEVLLSITAGTFTTIAVFFPILYLRGISSIFFKQQAITITYALLASLVMSITIIPCIFSRKFSKQRFTTPHKNKIPLINILKHSQTKKSFQNQTLAGKTLLVFKKLLIPLLLLFWLLVQLKEIIKLMLKYCLLFLNYLFKNTLIFFIQGINKIIKPLGEWNEKFWSKVKIRYEKTLQNLLHKRELTIVITIIFFLISLFLVPYLPRRFIPRLKPDKLNIIVNQKSGTPIKTTSEKIKRIEEYLKNIPEIKTLQAFVGEEYSDLGLISYKKNAEHKGYLVLELNSEKIKNMDKFKTELKNDINYLLGIEEQKEGDLGISVVSGGNVYEDIFSFGDYPFEINIYQNNFDNLIANEELLKNKLHALGKLSEIKSNLYITKPTYIINLNESILKTHNLTKDEVMQKLQKVSSGDKIDELVRGNDITDIVFRNFEKTEENRNLDINHFLSKKILLNNHLYSIRSLVDLEKQFTPEEIIHQDQMRSATIFAKLKSEADYQETLTNIKSMLLPLSKKMDFKYELSGENKRIKENFGGLIFAFIIAIILVYMILGIQFESFYLPFVIILTIPLSIIGVIYGLLITGISINIMSLIGLVVLVGIVVNDSIVKIDTIIRIRKSGKPLITAVLEAGERRFRPIIMTSLTTIFGLIPLALNWGTGAQLAQPLAVTVISGLIFSTLLTLFVIPIIYVIFEKAKKQN